MSNDTGGEKYKTQIEILHYLTFNYMKTQRSLDL